MTQDLIRARAFVESAEDLLELAGKLVQKAWLAVPLPCVTEEDQELRNRQVELGLLGDRIQSAQRLAKAVPHD